MSQPSFEPNISILPASQRLLWLKLKDTPPQFTLYGGTALALRLGHRQSVDFDFFANCAIDPQQLLNNISYLENASVIQVAPNTLTVIVDSNGPVRLSYFGLPKLGSIKQPDYIVGAGIKIASLIDLAGTKVAVVQKRVEAKDYLDIDAIIISGGISLSEALAAGKLIYGDQFNPQITLKALSCFVDPELAELPEVIKLRLVEAIRQVDLDHLPNI